MKTIFTLLRNRIGLAFLIVPILTLSTNSGHYQKDASVSLATSFHGVFGMSISPNGASILLFGSEVQKGDDQTGILALATFPGMLTLFEQVSALPGEGAIVWTSENVAYVSAADGIFKIDSEKGQARLVVKKDVAGLAVSPQGSRFAVWQLGGSNYDLVVYDLKSAKVLRQWSLPALFSGHLSGFQLAFLTEDLVVARTFDSEFRTPLKVFDVARNSVTQLAPNAYSVVPVPNGVATVIVGKKDRTLSKISEGMALVPVQHGFQFDVLEPTGNPRRLAARTSSKNTALIDTDDWSTHELKRECYPIALARSGKAFVFQQGRIESAPPACVSGLAQLTRPRP